MSFRIGIVGAGQFAQQFAELFDRHPLVDGVYATDVIQDRARDLVAAHGLAGTFESFESMLASDIEAVAIFTQRWTHGEFAIRALEAGKHVYSTVPMGIAIEELQRIVELTSQSGLHYMMGETSYYNPTTLYARSLYRSGGLGEVFYAEGDYVHDMDNGFYSAYQYSGGDDWRVTASFPPMLYDTHAVGGVLGAIDAHVVSASCIGVVDKRGDGVFDEEISAFDNNFSNCTALYELSSGGALRTNEFRRVGYPTQTRESRFRFFGTEMTLETVATVSLVTTRKTVTDVSALLHAQRQDGADATWMPGVDQALRDSFISGFAPVHEEERARLPEAFLGASNGHEGSHQFLVDDFARAIDSGTPAPMNARMAARITAPGIIAHQSALRQGERLGVPIF